MQFIALLLLLFADAKTEPKTLTGKVISVYDGDTITILVDKTQIKIRLNGIDAPETKPSQAFGTKAKEHLSEFVFGNTVRVEPHDKGILWIL